MSLGTSSPRASSRLSRLSPGVSSSFGDTLETGPGEHGSSESSWEPNGNVCPGEVWRGGQVVAVSFSPAHRERDRA